jgi:hypothetical protein
MLSGPFPFIGKDAGACNRLASIRNSRQSVLSPINVLNTVLVGNNNLEKWGGVPTSAKVLNNNRICVSA